MAISDEKKALRKYIISERDKLTNELIYQKSSEITYRITEDDDFILAKFILSYVSFRSEVCTSKLIDYVLASEKKLAVPRVHTDGMNFYIITQKEDLETATMGILEPKEDCQILDPRIIKNPEKDIFMIVPGLAFDRKGHRLGYGGGYYDRYLAGAPRFTTAALAFDLQIMDEVPYEKTDRIVDYIFTETEKIKCVE